MSSPYSSLSPASFNATVRAAPDAANALVKPQTLLEKALKFWVKPYENLEEFIQIG